LVREKPRNLEKGFGAFNFVNRLAAKGEYLFAVLYWNPVFGPVIDTVTEVVDAFETSIGEDSAATVGLLPVAVLPRDDRKPLRLLQYLESKLRFLRLFVYWNMLTGYS